MTATRHSATVAEVGERGLLKAIARCLGRRERGVVIGVGDDAAVLEGVGPHAVLSTDLLIEGIDFDFAWAKPEDVGAKAAAVNLSDLAGMGARPRALLLSLGIRPTDRVRDVMALVASMHREGRRYGAPLVGGDLSRTAGPMIVAVTVIGEAEKGRALRRGCGRPGDVVLVSGELGAAAAGLALLSRGERQPCALTRRQLRPTPRIALGLALARSGLVRSCADVSDGLASDAQHVAGPGCGVALDPARLPIARGVAAVAAGSGRSPLDLALRGGEDFELVIAVAPRHATKVKRLATRAGARLTAVGEVVRGRGVQLVGGEQLGGGFDHFSTHLT